MMKRTLTKKKIQQTRRLLIRSTNWIGDAIMTTPAVRAIRKNFFNARISILAKPWVAPVFEHSPRVDEIIVYDAKGRHKGIRGIARLSRELKPMGFDAAILLQNAIEAAIIPFLAGIKTRIGFDTDARRLLLTHPVSCTKKIKSIHQTGYYLEMLKGAGLFDDTGKLELFLGETDRNAAEKILKKNGILPVEQVVGINPSATFGPAKQWFPEKYAALADKMIETLGVKIIIFGGPLDRDLGKSIVGMMRNRAVDLCGRTRLGVAMALIDRCRAFVTNDSGLMHVAAALDTPLVAVFGSTNHKTTSPWSEKSRIVRVPVECSPCMKMVCPLGHMQCMKKVSVDMVLGAVKDVM